MKTRIKLVLMAALTLTLVGAAVTLAQQGTRRNVPPPRPQGPCDIYGAAGDPCVAMTCHSPNRRSVIDADKTG
jgi:non-reducing end alpha-L-arabinofuranosidase